MGHHEYRALSEMLLEVAHRCGKPMFIAETGSEGSGGPAWLHYVCRDEVRAAMGVGASIRGYLPVPDNGLPGLGQFASCRGGLFSAIHPNGTRRLRQPVADELVHQQDLFTANRTR